MYAKEVIECLNSLKIEKRNKKEVYVRARFGPSKLTKIPLSISNELATFVGMVLGDGHLKQNKFQISIELSNKNLINIFGDLCIYLFNRKVNIYSRERQDRKRSYYCVLDSKAIYILLNKLYNVPSGKKSNIISVPVIVKHNNKDIKRAFLTGVLVTEGGRRRKGIGLSSASKIFRNDIAELFMDFGMRVHLDEWEHKKYKKKYFGLYFKVKELPRLVRGCRSGQTDQILKSFLKDLEG